MDKEQIKQELKMAYKEREYKQEMLNFVDRDFVDVVIYEIKAIDCKIKALKNMLDKKSKFDYCGVDYSDYKESNREYWNNYLRGLSNAFIPLKKESSATKLNDSL